MEYMIEGILTLTLAMYIIAPLFMRDRWQAFQKENEVSDEMA